MKKQNSFIKLVSQFFTFFFVFYVIFVCWSAISCLNAAATMSGNIPQEFLRIKIYGSSTDSDGSVGSSTVSGTFSIIDSNANEIAVIERSWSGSYLAVEFARIGMDGKYFVFPSRIY